MNFKRIKAISKKEFIQIFRDARSLALSIFIPLMLLILFGFALTLDVDNVPMAIWNQDKSQISNDFIRDFKNSRYFKIIGYYENYTDLMKLIDQGRAIMVMVIPKEFSKYINSNQPAPVQLLVDGSNSNTATIAMGYASAVVSRYNVRLLSNTFSQLGLKMPAPLDVRPRIWFNEDLKSRNFIIPGLIVVIIMIIAALLTSMTIARERERGTMEQLISTPVKVNELILGKLIPYFVIGLVDLLMAVAMAEFVYDIPLRGSFVLLLLLSSLFIIGSLMLGILISIIAPNQLMASQLAILATFLPGFLLSGFAYAISNMPKAIQLITYLIPARYFTTIIRGIYLKGVGIEVLWMETLLLFIFTAVIVIMANIKLKKRVA